MVKKNNYICLIIKTKYYEDRENYQDCHSCNYDYFNCVLHINFWNPFIMKDFIPDLKERAIESAKDFILAQYEPYESVIVKETIPFLDANSEQIGCLKIAGGVYEFSPAVRSNDYDCPDDPAKIEVELHELEVEITNQYGKIRVNLTNAINNYEKRSVTSRNSRNGKRRFS